MKWTVAKARGAFSEVLKQAREEPQLIFRRHEHVAAVVSPELLRQFLDWLHHRDSRSVADALASLRTICAEEGIEPQFSKRADRANAFAEVMDELSD